MPALTAPLTHDERIALTQTRDATLNGRPARICGASRHFARIMDLETGLACDWAWPTVARIVANGGEFKS